MSDQNLEMEYIIKYMSEEIHKILEIDLNTDSFKVIKANDNELDPSMGFSNKFSIWLKQFVENGLVHPSDVNRFLELTDLQHLRDYFAKGNRKLTLSYRRNIDGKYKWVSMRVIPSMNYSVSNPDVILFVQDDDSAESLDLINSAKQQLAVLQSVASIYVTLHAINFREDCVYDLNVLNSNGLSFAKQEHATEAMRFIMRARVDESYLDRVLEFSEISTLPERMKGKKFLQMDFLGKNLGWVRAIFITIDQDEDGKPKHVIFATTSINEEKQREEKLLQISTEMNLATAIQINTIPHTFPAFPDRKEFDLFASMDPAKEVGGDFYDFFFIDQHRIALVIADVSGKGVPAALFMMVSKVLIKNQSQTESSPAKILEMVNNQLYDGNQAEMFVTVWLGIIDLRTGLLTAANAGHEYPAICRNGESFELFKDRHGFVLAGMPNMRYRQYEIQLNPGDTVFVYTDGVAEATSADKELFGTERMLNALNSNDEVTDINEIASSNHVSEPVGDNYDECKKIISRVRAHIDDFVKDAPQFDDITMLAFKYNGDTKEE